MLNIDGKTFMNIQEAVQWLLDNNALPFQCTADYIANTEIGLGTIVNPSPAKVRIGSLIFFADSKVSTVIGLTENGFMVGSEYNDLIDDVVYVANVQLNASGHLIITLSDGSTIDAGLVKQITGMSIDGSQHLIANYNDGTSTDLGAIFTGNITVSGNLTVSGGISGNAITGDSIIENMTGYSASLGAEGTTDGFSFDYVGIVKNGNKLTFMAAGQVVVGETAPTVPNPTILSFNIPTAIFNKLYANALGGGTLDNKKVSLFNSSTVSVDKVFLLRKSGTSLKLDAYAINTLTTNKTYVFRYEVTFGLNESLV